MNKDNEQLWESYVSEKKHDEEKTVSGKADLDKDGKLSKYEKKRADAIAKNDDDPNTHACAKKVKHESFGLGTPIHARHAHPDDEGNIAWYAVQFEHGTEVVDTVNIDVLEEYSHGNH